MIDFEDIKERMAIAGRTSYEWKYYYKDSVYLYSLEWTLLKVKRYQRTRGKGYRKVQRLLEKSFYSDLESKVFWATHWHPEIERLFSNLGLDLPTDFENNRPHPFFTNQNAPWWHITHDGDLYAMNVSLDYADTGSVHVVRTGSIYEGFLPNPQLGRTDIPWKNAKAYFDLLTHGEIDNALMEHLL